MDFLSYTYMDEFITLFFLQLIAAASPGPDFAIVINHSLTYSRRIGLYTACGIAFGIIFHVIMAIFGIGFIVTGSWWLFNGVKIIAGGYLTYLSYKAFKASLGTTCTDLSFVSARSMSSKQAFTTGVLTNLLNPKVILFFLSIFSVVVSPQTPTPILVGYGATIFLITLGWFFFIAYCFSSKKAHAWFLGKEKWIHRITGFIFIFLALKLFYDLFTKALV